MTCAPWPPFRRFSPLFTRHNKRAAGIEQNSCKRLQIVQVGLTVGVEVGAVALFYRDNKWPARVEQYTGNSLQIIEVDLAVPGRGGTEVARAGTDCVVTGVTHTVTVAVGLVGVYRCVPIIEPSVKSRLLFVE